MQQTLEDLILFHLSIDIETLLLPSIAFHSQTSQSVYIPWRTLPTFRSSAITVWMISPKFLSPPERGNMEPNRLSKNPSPTTYQPCNHG